MLEVLEDRTLLTGYLVTNTNDSGAGSLRDAITQVNADTNHTLYTDPTNPNADEIDFNISGGGAQTINLASVLPQLTNAVYINGLTQGGNGNSTRLITVNGSAIADNTNDIGLVLQASNCTVSGLIIEGFDRGIEVDSANNTIGGTAAGAGNVLSGNGTNFVSSDLYDGILIAASGVTVQGNYIGTNAAGTGKLTNGADGIEIIASNVTIGGTAAGAGNVISGNTNDGVLIGGITATAGVSNVTVLGNSIGTNAAGTAAVANGYAGVELLSFNSVPISNVTISGNILSGNTQDGVLIDPGVSGVQIQGNRIGTNAAGTAPVANSIGLVISSSNITIGGTSTGAGNLISGNSGDGLFLGAGGSSVTVLGNLIGTNVAGIGPLGNSIGIDAAAGGDTIGGTSAAARNIISGNTTDGILLRSSNTVLGNFIGTNAAGTSALPNSIGVFDSAGFNDIGGTAAGAGNVISGNSNDGLYLGASGDTVLGNSIGTNAAGTGVVADSSNGIEVAAPNNTIGSFTGYNQLTGAIPASNVISGNGNDGILIDSGASGVTVQGNYIGTNAAGTSALGNGNGVELASPGDTISRNAISGNSNNGLLIDSGASGEAVLGNYIGTNANGTSAMGNANAGVYVLGSNNTIGSTVFSDENVISGNGNDGVYLAVSGVELEGNYIGTNAAGTGPVGNGNGVEVAAPGNSIGGNPFFTPGIGNIISGNSNDGVLLDGGASGTPVQGNYIGTNAAGTGPVGNGIGVEVNSANDLIGAESFGQGSNVISGNNQGVVIDSGVTGAAVHSNYIGTDPTSNNPVGNSIGVVDNASNSTIGGVFDGNVISGNNEGIYIPALVTGVQMLSNTIGTNLAGSAAVGNNWGIVVAGSNVSIGSTTAQGSNIVSLPNLISGNQVDGIWVKSTASGVLVQGNTIGANVTGNSAVGNGNGIEVAGSNVTIGGTLSVGNSSMARNLISGNLQDGVLIDHSATGVTVQGDYLGINAAGNAALGNSGNGIEVQGSNITLGGTTTAARNVISGNDHDGIVIDAGNGVSGVLVQGNYIGTSYTATSAIGNANGIEVGSAGVTIGGTTAAARNVVSGNQSDGILIDSTSSNILVQGNYLGMAGVNGVALANGNGIEIAGIANTLGGSVAGARNIISGNANDGVLLDSAASANQIQGNFIGTSGSGAAALSNSGNGMEIAGAHNTVGGTMAAVRNLLSGNDANGLLLDSTASGNLVQGNFIGTVYNGSAALGNSGNGIEALGTGNTLGGTTNGSRNVISGNGNDGVLLNTGDSGNLVQGNYVGTNSAGTAALANTSNGVEIAGNNNTLGGSVTAARNVISGNGNDGVLIDSGASGSQVQGNFIGANSTGLAALANSSNGVEVLSSNNTLGGTTAAARNLISGNGADGVLLGSGVSGVLIGSNYIGINYAGSAALGNGGMGVDVYGAGNTVGGSTASARNVISGNGQDGVMIENGASGVAVLGNYIGTDATGRVKVGNGGNGVEVGETNAVIGSTIASAHNIISGNAGDGVLIDSGTSGVRVQGNFIGTDVTGLAALANYNGIEVAGNNSTLGGTTSAARNVISGNSKNGVQIDQGATGNAVLGNYIGTNYTASGALANGAYGVSIAGNNNSVGSSVPAASNTIADNGLGGVQISAGNGNSIRHNAIYSNGPGITLAAGANNNLAAPTLSTATLSGSLLTVTGTFNAPTAGVPYVLEFFVSPAGDPEGKIYVGKLTVTPTSTGTQNFTFSVLTSAASSTTLITATLTDNLGDTSAFSNGVTS